MKPSIHDYVAFLYDQKWWIGIVLEINIEEGDVLVKFMHPNGPARSFSWPSKEVICLVPLSHILHKTEVPQPTTRDRSGVAYC